MITLLPIQFGMSNATKGDENQVTALHF